MPHYNSATLKNCDFFRIFLNLCEKTNGILKHVQIISGGVVLTMTLPLNLEKINEKLKPDARLK